jgi:hypothetical protein
MAVCARHRHCLTIIKVLIVSGFRLVQRNDIMSHPPEEMCSTATAEPTKRVGDQQDHLEPKME